MSGSELALPSMANNLSAGRAYGVRRVEKENPPESGLKHPGPGGNGKQTVNQSIRRRATKRFAVRCWRGERPAVESMMRRGFACRIAHSMHFPVPESPAGLVPFAWISRHPPKKAHRFPGGRKRQRRVCNESRHERIRCPSCIHDGPWICFRHWTRSGNSRFHRGGARCWYLRTRWLNPRLNQPPIARGWKSPANRSH